MPISAADVRELMLRGENETLDYKIKHHDADPDLAKDLMCIANRLRKTSEPGYLLIGVDEDENGRGVFATEQPTHADDDTYQQKVRNYVNPPLDFHFYEVPIDGFAVGVFEVRYSKRPIAAARTSGNKLQAGLAYVRRGTRNDLSTAHEIVDWAREDNLLDNEAAVMAMDELRARVELAPAFVGDLGSAMGDRDFKFVADVRNLGAARFVGRARVSYNLTPHGAALVAPLLGADVADAAQRPVTVAATFEGASEHLFDSPAAVRMLATGVSDYLGRATRAAEVQRVAEPVYEVALELECTSPTSRDRRKTLYGRWRFEVLPKARFRRLEIGTR